MSDTQGADPLAIAERIIRQCLPVTAAEAVVIAEAFKAAHEREKRLREQLAQADAAISWLRDKKRDPALVANYDTAESIKEALARHAARQRAEEDEHG